MSATQLGPAVARRKLARKLRSARREADLTSEATANAFGWSHTKVVRIENGSVSVSIPDTMALAVLFGLSQEEREQLVSLARMAKRTGWWWKYRSVLEPQVQQFLSFEVEATSICVFQPMIIPGLLQIEDYAKAIGPRTIHPFEEEKILNLLRVRTLRKSFVLDRGDNYTAIIDESAFYRRAGGVAVMREQINYLSDLTDRGVIELGILPLSQGARFAGTGAFHVMQYTASAATDAVLWLDSAHAYVQLEDKPNLVAMYGKLFDDIMEASMCGPDAIDFMQKTITQV